MSDPSTIAATPAPRRRRAIRAYLILAVVAVAVAGGWLLHHWRTANQVSTDDAQVDADVVPVSSRVAGSVLRQVVSDHQHVAKGDPLIELDPTDFEVEVRRAEADLVAARAQADAADAQVAVVRSSSTGGLSTAKAQLTGADAAVRGASAQIQAAAAAVARAKSDLDVAEHDLARAHQLRTSDAITARELEEAQAKRDVAAASLDQRTAELDGSREQRRLADSRVAEAAGRVAQSTPVDQQVASADAAARLAHARVTAAEVAVERAELARSYTRILAPVEGVVSKVAAHPGQMVGAGQPLLMLVPSTTYVVANLKEGDVIRIEPGDPVDIELDAFPDRTFSGVVETVSPATGARFSLLPPDNATGNFVKVVQRVPVKIAWKQPPTATLRPGLSADVTIHVKD